MNKKPIPSFEEIAKEVSTPLYAYLTRMAGNTPDADDILQETLLRIAHGLPGFKGQSSIKNWAFRIATNTAIDFFRKSKKIKFVEFSETDEAEDIDKDDNMILDEMNECVREVIDSLPPDYRAALILTHLEDKSVADAAKILNISISAAKVRVHRAKARLQKKLDKQCDFYQSKKGNLRCDPKDSKPCE